MLKAYGGQKRCLALEPDQVFVVVILVNGLISCQVEAEILHLAVNLFFTHSRYPIVMRLIRIIASVVVDDGGAVFVGLVPFAVDLDIACDLKEILLRIKRSVVAERNGNDARKRNPVKLNVIADAAALVIACRTSYKGLPFFKKVAAAEMNHLAPRFGRIAVEQCL